MKINTIEKTNNNDKHLLWPALLSGFFLWLSYPPFRVGWLAWVALVPLSAAALMSARESGSAAYKGVKAALLGGALWGFGLFHPLLFTTEGAWYEQAGGLIILTVLLAIVCAMYYVFLKSLFMQWHDKRALVVLSAASGWAVAEFLIRWAAVGFAPYIGVTQWRQAVMLSLASVVGIHGIGWIIVAVNVTLLMVVDRLTGGTLFRPKASNPNTYASLRRTDNVVRIVAVLTGLLAAAGAATGGFWVMPKSAATASSSPLRLLLVQPNITNEQYYVIDRTDEGHYDVLDRLVVQTESALANIACPAGSTSCDGNSVAAHVSGDDTDVPAGPLLVVWPETVLHMAGEDDARVREAIRSLTSRWNAGLVIGMPRRDQASPPLAEGGDRARFYNSAFVFEPGGVMRAAYDKIHVIPIAEAQFTAGDSTMVVNYADHFLGLGICSDMVVPRHARRTVLAGAHTLHYVSSFGQVARLAPLATALAMFRAAEHRVHVVQTATTGPSMLINPRGELVATTSPNEVATLFVAVPPVTHYPTIYTRFGDWVIIAAGLFVAVIILWAQFYEKQRNDTWRLAAPVKTNR